MRAFLSNFLLATFIVVFAVPQTLLAQSYNWTPPTGAAFQNNTPSPINVSGFEQTKSGALNLGPGTPNNTSGNVLSVNGQVILSPTQNEFDGAQPSNQILASFLSKTAFFGKDTFWVGHPLGTGGSPSIVLSGQLKYTPRDANGNPIAGQQPADGRVLTSMADGTLGFTDGGLPPGSEDGDILIWNSNCQCWETGPVTTGTTLPDGVNQGDILVWNGTTWVIGQDQTGGPGSLPAGAQGQTMWYDNNAWRATDQIKHDSYTPSIPVGSPAVTRTYINNEVVKIPGSREVEIGTDNGISVTRLKSKNVVVTGSGYISLGSGAPNSFTTLASPTVTFNNGGGNQDVNFGNINGNVNNNHITTFFSNAVKFKGPAGDPLALAPGAGRIPYSADEDGTFKWNRSFTYLNIPSIIIPGFPNITVPAYSRLKLANNSPTEVSTFQNEGMTLLQDNLYADGKVYARDDVRVEDTGDLYLDEVDAPSILPSANVGLIPLCWNLNTKKVMRCPGSGGNGGSTPPGGAANTPNSLVTQTFYEDTTLNFDDIEETTPVTITYCGAGGGGGGGGAGDINPDVDQVGSDARGKGGGGGAGGRKGVCLDQTVNVDPGDELFLDVGDGGQGGKGSVRQVSRVERVGSISATDGPGVWDVFNPAFYGFANWPGIDINGNINIIYEINGIEVHGGFQAGNVSSLYDLGTLDNNVVSSIGGAGGATLIKKNGVQVGASASGGLGGDRGGNAGLLPGAGGVADVWWRGGQMGRDVNGNFTDFDGVSQVGSGSYGGAAGSGERHNPTEENPHTPSASGHGYGGYSGPTTASGNWRYDPWFSGRWGVPGVTGLASNGGGGGGGSSGYPSVDTTTSYATVPSLRGGKGGNGGPGYVTVTYSTPGATGGFGPDTSWVKNTAGTHTFDLSTLPSQTTSLTIEVWGSGGGGGPVTNISSPVNLVGGGGASGTYKTINWPIPAQCIGNPSLCGSLTAIVAPGGNLGISGGNLTHATDGSQTKVQRNTGVVIITGNGGKHGIVANPSAVPVYEYQNGPPIANSPMGVGGVGGGVSGVGSNNPNDNINGNPGQSGSNGGFGGSAIINGFGRGGNGAKVQNIGGIPSASPATAGQDGGVRISW